MLFESCAHYKAPKARSIGLILHDGKRTYELTVENVSTNFESHRLLGASFTGHPIKAIYHTDEESALQWSGFIALVRRNGKPVV